MRTRDIPAYVVHGPHLVDRRARLGADLEGQGVTPEWIDEFVAASLDPKVVRRHYRPNRLRWRRRTALTQRIPFRELTPAEIAVGISHAEAFRRIAAREPEWGFVFEDDVLLDPDFAERLDVYLPELPPDADLVFVGTCCGLHANDVEPGVHFYRQGDPSSRCCDSYLVSRRAARILAKAAVPFVVTMDWELSYHAARHDLHVYWLEPPLAVQGSETGAYASSLR
jgi:GR25 family glycosyltransferase involved in LPS biosynthesis